MPSEKGWTMPAVRRVAGALGVLSVGSLVLSTVGLLVLPMAQAAGDSSLKFSIDSSRIASMLAASNSPGSPEISIETPEEAAIEPTTSNIEFVDAVEPTPVAATTLGSASSYGASGVSIARVDMPADIAVMGVTWDDPQSRPESVSYRTLEEGTWSQWSFLDVEVPPADLEVPEGAEQPKVGTEPVFLANIESVEVVAQGSGGEQLEGLRLVFIDVRGNDPVENALADAAGIDTDSTRDASTREPAAEPAPAQTLGSSANEPQTAASSAAVSSAPKLNADGTQLITGFQGLTITTRKGWGADESWRQGFRDIDVTFKGAVVHHTQGGNDYTKAQVPGILRGIYNYHANSLGWRDIGYQILVDKYGGVWEGRYGGLTGRARGAQAKGANSDTFGISIMGDFRQTVPPTVALDALNKTTAWKLQLHGIKSISGKITVPGYYNDYPKVDVVSAHRDIGATDCPGDAFYARMNSVRSGVASYLAASASTSKAPETISAAAFPEISIPYGEVQLSGTNRYKTAAVVSQKLFPAGSTSTHAFVASGEDFPDAVPMSALAAHAGGSLLLTRKDSLPPETRDELTRLKPEFVWLAGGYTAVSLEVENAIRTAVPAAEIVRLAGKSRFETSKLIADRFPVGSPAIVTTGINYPDALVAAGAVQRLSSGTGGGAVVLSYRTNLDSYGQQALERLKPGKAYIVGGTWEADKQQVVRDSAGLTSVPVISGHDRYETSARVSAEFWGNRPDSAIYTTGLNFPDALTTGPLSASIDAPTLLLRQKCATESVIQIQPVSRLMVGGPSVVEPGASIKWCGG